MNALSLSARIENARMLWISKQRRISWSVAAVATQHALWRFAHMNPVLPHEEIANPQMLEAYKRITPADMDLIMQIAARGVAIGAEHNIVIDKMLATQDIATVHAVSRHLKLWQFLASDTSDFAHDFTAIGRFLDRKAGVLTGGVVLRFQKAQQ